MRSNDAGGSVAEMVEAEAEEVVVAEAVVEEEDDEFEVEEAVEVDEADAASAALRRSVNRTWMQSAFSVGFCEREVSMLTGSCTVANTVEEAEVAVVVPAVHVAVSGCLPLPDPMILTRQRRSCCC